MIRKFYVSVIMFLAYISFAVGCGPAVPGDGGERDPDGDCARDAAGRAQQPREAGRHQRAPQLTGVHQGKL